MESSALRTLGRRVVLEYGRATSWVRALPDFLIIGAKRCGTTSLYRYLEEHPAIAPLFPSAEHLPLMRENQKGVHFFDTGYAHGSGWYRAHFRMERTLRRRDQITGEASPYYLFHPLAAARAVQLVPTARIIVLLREPVARTYSHWSEQTRNGVETLSFADALAAEETRCAGEVERIRQDPAYISFPHEQQTYAGQSDYADGLRRWLEHFPRAQWCPVRSEDLYADPQGTFDTVTQFLGLDAHRLRDPKPWNAAPAPPLDSEVRHLLDERFAQPRAEVQELVGIEWS